jgi:hypothetical protein
LYLFSPTSHAHVFSTAGWKAKKAKEWQAAHPDPSNNLELHHIKDIKSAPAWFPKRQEIWDHAVLHFNPLDMAQA